MKISIVGITFHGYHGILKEERNLGQRFKVDVEIEGDFEDCIKDDDLSKTVDYREICKIVKETERKRKYKLIESLASDIADEILRRFKKVKKVRVCVSKQSPPIDAFVDYVKCELTKDRNLSKN